MSLFLGIDTSNYTTSAAIVDQETGEVFANRQLLHVKSGAKGLRQSDALYEHVKNLPLILESLPFAKDHIAAIGVSSRPRDRQDSYMPCFEAGIMAARSIASVNHIPYYTFSHQAGHIASALFSVNRLELLESDFVAFHVSGGTTEAVSCKPDSGGLQAEIIAQSLDLKAGQAVDRVGQMLGLPFPSGPQLEQLALRSTKSFSVKPCIKNTDCCLSGLENLCADMVKSGCEPCDIARFCIEYIKVSLDGMIKAFSPHYRRLPLIFAGGVMSNTIIQAYFTDQYGAIFAKPGYSTDNAVGIAVLAKRKVVAE